MPLMPKKTKYRKQHKGRNRGKATRGNKVVNGEYGLQSLELGQITSNQIEAARVALNRYMKRSGKVWITIFPDKPITKKPADTRMGKGKGSVEYWVAVVKPGRVMFEVAEIPEDVAREALIARYNGTSATVRTDIVNALNRTAEDSKSNVENGVQDEISRAKQERQSYLESLGGY